MQLSETLKKFGQTALGILYPTNIKCIFCGDELSSISAFCTCEKCLKNLPFIDDNNICEICGMAITSLAKICDTCHEKKPAFKLARAPFEYTGLIRFIINRFKYYNEKYLAKPLSHFMHEIYLKNNYNCNLILFSPLTEEKQKSRGYNQAELLAVELAKFLNLEVKNNIIFKVKNTLTQTKLTKPERKINLENAFVVKNKKQIKNKSILLVDDVFTTGSTVNHISELLIKSGAKEVKILTLAHTNFYNKSTEQEKFVQNFVI